MKYRDRQEEVDWFQDGEELLRTFRGRGKDVLKAARRFASQHWRIQRSLSDSVMYDVLAGKESWSPAVGAVDDLALDVHRNPRAYCEPPELPDDWDRFRTALAGYAPADWWHRVLELEDVLKPSTLRSALSRPDGPRKFDEIKKRAVLWRARVMCDLDTWETTILEQEHRREMFDYRIRDVLEARGRDAAYQEYMRLRAFDVPLDQREMQYFDPAKTREPWVWLFPPRDDVQGFEDLLASGFPRYRDATPEADRVETRQELVGWASDDLRYQWELPTEVEIKLTWCPMRRRMIEKGRRWLRLQVLVPSSKYAREGERIETRRFRVRGDGTWWYDFEEFVRRWRSFDLEHDTRGGVDGRDEVMKRVGANFEHDDLNTYLMDKVPTIEDLGRDWYE